MPAVTAGRGETACRSEMRQLRSFGSSQEAFSYVELMAHFRPTDESMMLTAVAPGIDIDKDILGGMDFEPLINEPRQMEPRLFLPQVMGLKDEMLSMSLSDRIYYDQSANNIFLNFAGLRVQNAKDVHDIRETVEGRMAPLRKRVHSVVNHDNFVINKDAMDDYADLVEYIEQTYYLSVHRYTTSAFLRLKLGKELGKRALSSRN
ncbi:MAG: propionate CoA-transferase [Gammaproteobacteria bacterium]|jgi:propionate CoA-transferase